MRSNPAHKLYFIFQLENIFRSNLTFWTFYGRFTNLQSLLDLLLVSFLWLAEKISLKYNPPLPPEGTAPVGTRRASLALNSRYYECAPQGTAP